MTKCLCLALLVCVVACAIAEPTADHIAEQWAKLCKADGCLTGHQDFRPSSLEGCVFREQPWQEFFRQPTAQTVPFLMSRLTSTNRTSVHLCPWHNAAEGQLAVYASQHILQTNWFQCSATATNLTPWVKRRDEFVSPLVPHILADDAAQEELKQFFLKEAKGKAISNKMPGHIP